MEKTCTRCNRILPLEEFGKDSSKKDGKSNYCKECSKSIAKQSRENQKKYFKRLKELQQEALERQLTDYDIIECPKCRRILLSADFYHSKNSPTGFSKICKECTPKKRYKKKFPKKLKEFKEDIEQFQENTIKYKLAKITAEKIIEGRIAKYRTDNNISKEQYLKEIGCTFNNLLEDIRKGIIKNCIDNYEECWCDNKHIQQEKEEKRSKINAYQRKKYKEDDLYRFKLHVRSLVRTSFRQKNWKKNKETQEIIGCSFEELKAHLEQTWLDNYGTQYNNEPVHIDHIIPLSTATSQEEVVKLCHWTNLQYLKPEDNLSKHDKLNWELSK